MIAVLLLLALLLAEPPTVVLVPGMTGSKLCHRDTGAVLWGDSTRLMWPWDGGYGLALALDQEEDPLVPCGVIRVMRVANWRKDIYGGLISRLRAAGFPVIAWDYDWRRDNVEIARRLTRRLEELAASGQQRVVLLCQSNAGQICRYAVRFGDVSLEEAEEGSARRAEGVQIEKLILVGTSSGGALRILRELNQGRQYIRPIGRRFRPEVFFTFRSLFQDLPVYRKTLFPLAEADLFDAKEWREYGWSIFGRDVQRRLAKRVPSWFGNEQDRMLYLREALDRAARLHRLMRSEAGTSGLPPLYSIQSRDFATPSHALLEKRGDHWHTKLIASAPGDLHATAESQLWLAEGEVAMLARPTLVVRGKHFEMITTDETQTLLLEILASEH